MNLELLRQKLLAAARLHRPSDHVPYAFEKRLMARLRDLQIPDPWAAWSALLWRALAPCCALMVIAGLGSLVAGSGADDLGDQLDAVLLADLDTVTDAP